MPKRPRLKFRPELERFEDKQLLSAGPLTGHAAGSRAPADLTAQAVFPPPPPPTMPIPGLTLDRITNPHDGNQILIPPFQHVLVQTIKPVPGQVYNVLFLSLWNGTNRTFTAADGLTVKSSNQTRAHAYPILTGNQVWAPGQRIVFYELTKKYYPLSPTK